MAYIGRSGWNDLAFGGGIPDEELLEAVDESYRLVVGQAAQEAPARGLGRLTYADSRASGRLAPAGQPDQAGDDERDVEHAGDLLDHHQRPGVVEHRVDVGQPTLVSVVNDR